MLIIFFVIKGIVHFEFIPKGQTANQAYYLEILKLLHEYMHRKRPEIWSKDCTLHHDIELTRRSVSSSSAPQNRLLKWNTHPIPLV
jgi:hypothetical protein